jgi:hypothetical protein
LIYGYGQGSISGNTFSCGGADAGTTAIVIYGGGSVQGNNILNVNGTAIYAGEGDRIIGNTIWNVARNGIVVSSAQVIVEGNRVMNASSGTDDTYYSISIAASVTHCIIDGNICTNTAANKPHTVIIEGTGANKNIITSNVATGGVTAQITTVGADTISANNITA